MRRFLIFFVLVFLSFHLFAGEPPKTTPKTTIDDLWVVDSSQYSTGLMLDVNDNIHIYFEELRKANVKSHGVFIAADALTTYRSPIRNEKEEILFLDHQDLEIDWWERYSDAWNKHADPSPLIAIRRFLLKLPKLTQIYETTYHRAGVPTNVTVFVSDLDGFHKHAIGSQQEFWGPNDFVDSFKAFHQQTAKSIQINIVAEKDLSPIAVPGGIDFVYTQMTQRTGGTLYPWVRGTDMATIMRSLAANAIKRARN